LSQSQKNCPFLGSKKAQNGSKKLKTAQKSSKTAQKSSMELKKFELTNPCISHLFKVLDIVKIEHVCLNHRKLRLLA
jgi:hypothetical protein